MQATDKLSAWNRGVWYKILGTGQQLVLSTCHVNTNVDTVMEVYKDTADSCNLGQALTYNDDELPTIVKPICEAPFASTVKWHSEPGVWYKVHVRKFNDSEPENQFTVTAVCNQAPSNDFCDTAEVESTPPSVPAQARHPTSMQQHTTAPLLDNMLATLLACSNITGMSHFTRLDPFFIPSNQ